LVPDASTTVYRRKTPENDALKVEVRERIKALPPEQQRPVRGLFPWERVV
jgi:hypothetical protein